MKVSLCIGITTILIFGMLIAIGSADPHYGLVVGTNPYSSGYPPDGCCNYPHPPPLPDGHASYVCDDCNPCTI